MIPLRMPERTSCWRITPSALPRKRTPCGRMQAPLPVLFIDRMMCRRKA